MNIGIFTDAYTPQINGVSLTVKELEESLRELGHKVYVIAPSYPSFKDEKDNILRIFSFRLLKEPHIRFALPLPTKGFIRSISLKFDIIHGFGGGPITFLGLLLSRLRKKPYVYTHNTRWQEYSHYILSGKIITAKMIEKLNAVFCNWCDHVVAPTEPIKKEITGFGVKRPVTVITNGVDTNVFGKRKKGFLRRKTGIGKEEKILLYVGRLSKEKSIDIVLKAFKLISDEEKQAKLVIVGDGPQRRELEDLAKSLAITQNVFFTGYVLPSERANVYADGDIFLFASRTETQGMVILEALASALPVVVVSDPVFLNIVKDGDNGLVVGNSYQEFAKAVLFLLRNSDYRNRLSQNALETAKEFSLGKVALKFESLYKQIISDAKNKRL